MSVIVSGNIPLYALYTFRDSHIQFQDKILQFTIYVEILNQQLEINTIPFVAGLYVKQSVYLLNRKLLVFAAKGNTTGHTGKYRKHRQQFLIGKFITLHKKIEDYSFGGLRRNKIFARYRFLKLLTYVPEHPSFYPGLPCQVKVKEEIEILV